MLDSEASPCKAVHLAGDSSSIAPPVHALLPPELIDKTNFFGFAFFPPLAPPVAPTESASSRGAAPLDAALADSSNADHARSISQSVSGWREGINVRVPGGACRAEANDLLCAEAEDAQAPTGGETEIPTPAGEILVLPDDAGKVVPRSYIVGEELTSDPPAGPAPLVDVGGPISTVDRCNANRKSSSASPEE